MRQLISLAVSQATADTGFSFGTLLLFIGGAIMLAFFCSLGLIARIREHKIEQRTETTSKAAATARAKRASGPADVPDQLPDAEGHQHGQGPADDDAQHRL